MVTFWPIKVLSPISIQLAAHIKTLLFVATLSPISIDALLYLLWISIDPL